MVSVGGVRRDFCRGRTFATALQDAGDDYRGNHREYEDNREWRPGKMLRRQLTDEILRRLHGIAGLGDVLARFERYAVEVRAVGARERGTDGEHGRVGMGLADLGGDVAQRGVNGWVVFDGNNLEVDAVLTRLLDDLTQRRHIGRVA